MAKVQLDTTLTAVEIADLTAFLKSLTGTLPDNFVVAPVLPAASFIAQPGNH
jgi:hypothetical protein